MRQNNIIVFIVFLIVTTSMANGAVLFESDFEQYNGETWVGTYVSQGVTGTHGDGLPGPGVPTGFTGYINQSVNNDMRIGNGYGRSGGGGLRIGPAYGGTTDQVGLAVYLPNASGVYDYSGHDEIYVRFWIKYDQTWDWLYSGGNFYYHKWLRIWQNVPENRIKGLPPEGDEPAQTMAAEEHTGYTVCGIGEDNSGEFSPYWYSAFCRDPDQNSSSGRAVLAYNHTYASTQGFLENYFGNINASGTFDDAQDWHCFEYHLRLATSDTIHDGVSELYIDGVLQGDSGFRIQQNPTINPYTGDEFAPAKLGVGINYIVFFDNAANFFWDSQHYIYADDLVIATEYVGIDYVIGSEYNSPTITVDDTNTGTSSSGTITGTATKDEALSYGLCTWSHSSGSVTGFATVLIGVVSGTVTGLPVGETTVSFSLLDSEGQEATDTALFTRLELVKKAEFHGHGSIKNATIHGGQ